MRRGLVFLSLVLIGAGAIGCGSGTSSNTSPAAARAKARQQRLINSDTKAKVEVREAVTAIEVYATDHNGIYEGATAAQLQNIDPKLRLDLAVHVQQPFSYSVSVTSKASGTAFTVVKVPNGMLAYSCTPVGVGLCPANGDWGS